MLFSITDNPIAGAVLARAPIAPSGSVLGQRVSCSAGCVISRRPNQGDLSLSRSLGSNWEVSLFQYTPASRVAAAASVAFSL